MRESIRGSVYLECQMNPGLRQLLERIPGILRTRAGVLSKCIPHLDGVRLLRMKEAQSSIGAGDWVRIKRGIYKGDTGLVYRAETWGVDVLLAPRISYHTHDKKQKRKATPSKPPPMLFDVAAYERLHPNSLIHQEDGSYMRGNMQIINGLLLNRYGYSAINSQINCMPLDLFTLFCMSNHPSVLEHRPPRPSEWVFNENDQVVIKPSNKRGFVLSSDGSHVEIEVESEGVHSISWFNVLKRFDVGNYVRIGHGRYRSQAGFVSRVVNECAHVYLRAEEAVSTSDISKDPVKVRGTSF